MYERVLCKIFWTLLGYTVTKVPGSPRSSTWFTRPFLLVRGWGLGTSLVCLLYASWNWGYLKALFHFNQWAVFELRHTLITVICPFQHVGSSLAWFTLVELTSDMLLAAVCLEMSFLETLFLFWAEYTVWCLVNPIQLLDYCQVPTWF